MPDFVFYILVFLAVGVFFLFIHMLMGHFIRPNRPDDEKLTIYECGEPTVGSAWIQFDLRYYVVALLFVIFDVEVAFFFPWAVVFGKANELAALPDKNEQVEKIVLKLNEIDVQLKSAEDKNHESLLAEKKKLSAEITRLDKRAAITRELTPAALNLAALLEPLPATDSKTPGDNGPGKEEKKKQPGKGKQGKGGKKKDAEAAQGGLPGPGGPGGPKGAPTVVQPKDIPPIDSATAKSWAWIAFADLMVFFGVLMVGFAYLWRRGDINWVRSVAAENET